MGQFYRQVIRFLEQLDTQEWVLVLLGLVVVGFVCMRGFGSRSDY
jgi:hypothetical protein